jgi:hypothetical protein
MCFDSPSWVEMYQPGYILLFTGSRLVDEPHENPVKAKHRE